MPADIRPASPRAAKPRHRQAGFTLVELLVCLAICGIVIAFLPASFMGRSGAGLKASASDMAAALRGFRDCAIQTGRAGTFTIDPATGTFRDAAGQARTLPAGMRASSLARNGTPGMAIRFFPDGSATGGGVVLSQDGKRLEVLADWLTGRVTIVSGADSANR